MAEILSSGWSQPVIPVDCTNKAIKDNTNLYIGGSECHFYHISISIPFAQFIVWKSLSTTEGYRELSIGDSILHMSTDIKCTLL